MLVVKGCCMRYCRVWNPWESMLGGVTMEWTVCAYHGHTYCCLDGGLCVLLAVCRWYPTTLVLPDGRMYITAGDDKNVDGDHAYRYASGPYGPLRAPNRVRKASAWRPRRPCSLFGGVCVGCV